jgi:20S proteasome alpha/beta subunit
MLDAPLRPLRKPRPIPERHYERKPPVTVCIGVISHPLVIVASDRMITSADIQFEQQQPKIFTLAPNTLALISGDIAAQTELVDMARRKAASYRVATVEAAARVFADCYGDYCRRRAEVEVLRPLGVSTMHEVFAADQWPPEIKTEIAAQVREHVARNDAIATIIAGVDDSGPHLFVVEKPGQVSNYDRIGFASVGIGQRHAESQFMFAGYTPWWYFPKALYLTYVAKKRAEVAPGVGKYTDLAVITSQPRNVVTLDPHFIPILDRVYGAEVNAVGAMRVTSDQELERSLTEFLKEEVEKRKRQGEQPPTEGTQTATQTVASPGPESVQSDPEPPKRGRKHLPPSQE